jgi:predicted neuraminidase
MPSSEAVDEESHHSWLLIAKEGESWRRLGPIAQQSTEPCLVRTRDKIVQIFLRNRQKDAASRFVLHAQFEPQTEELFPARATNLPNPDSGVDAVALADGRLLMAANPCHVGRSPLTLLASRDDGATWQPLFNLQEGAGDFTQPALLEAADGKLHVIFSFWHKETSEKNIKHLIIDTTKI